MKQKAKVLIFKFHDRAGRPVYDEHDWPDSRKTLTAIAQTPVTGQYRFPVDDQDDVLYEPAVEVVDDA